MKKKENITEKIDLGNGEFIYRTTVYDWDEWDKNNKEIDTWEDQQHLQEND